MIKETPEIYRNIVVPYIESFPPERIEWWALSSLSFRRLHTHMYDTEAHPRVYNILEGKKEAERVLFRDEDPANGFIILPDLKWDETSKHALVRTITVP